MESAFATKFYSGKGDGGADSIEESLEVYADNTENENDNAAVDAIIIGTAVYAGNWDIPERVLVAYRHGTGAGGTSSVPDRGRTQYSNDNAAVDAIIEEAAVDAGSWDIPEKVLVAYRHGTEAGGTSSVSNR